MNQASTDKSNDNIPKKECENEISVKVRIPGSGVRRFGVSSFPEFVEKMEHFNVGTQSAKKWFWLDNDGDWICFSSADEWKELVSDRSDEKCVKIRVKAVNPRREMRGSRKRPDFMKFRKKNKRKMVKFGKVRNFEDIRMRKMKKLLFLRKRIRGMNRRMNRFERMRNRVRIPKRRFLRMEMRKVRQFDFPKKRFERKERRFMNNRRRNMMRMNQRPSTAADCVWRAKRFRNDNNNCQRMFGPRFRRMRKMDYLLEEENERFRMRRNGRGKRNMMRMRRRGRMMKNRVF